MAQGGLVDTLFYGSTRVILDDYDEFLTKFEGVTLHRPDIIAEIHDALQTGAPIGQRSAMGYAMLTQDGNVVKVLHLCGGTQQTEMKDEMCIQAKTGDKIYRFPSSFEGKEIVFAPGYITESIIGVLLSDENSAIPLYTPSVPRTLGFQYVGDPEYTVYTVMDRLNSLNDKIHNEYDLIYMFFQSASALNTLQKLNRFTHYDLHTGNLMTKPRDNYSTVYVYQLNNGQYLYSWSFWDICLIDFGFSRMETGRSVIMSSTPFFGPRRGGQYVSYYSFDPYVDMFCLLYFGLFWGRRSDGSVHGRPVNFAMGDPPTRNLIARRLIVDFLNIDVDMNNYDATTAAIRTSLHRIIGNSYPNMWRPIPPELSKYDPGNNIYPALSPEDFMSKIADFLVEMQQSTQPGFDATEKYAVARYLRDYGMVVSTRRDIDLIGRYGITHVKYYDLPPDTMNTRYYPTVNADNEYGNAWGVMTLTSDHNFNLHDAYGREIDVRRTLANFNKQPRLPSSMVIRNDLSTQFVHVAFIYQAQGMANGYRWKMECCRVDMRNYFNTPTIASGIAINAGFYRLHKDFLPIGYYRTDDIVFNIPVPEGYGHLYGMVGIDHNGELDIVRGLDPKNARDYPHILSVGPVLVWNGQRVMTDNELYDPDLECRLPTQTEYQYARVNNEEVPENLFAVPGDANSPVIKNCSNVSPGELSHAANPNPRSALAIMDGGIVLMVYVEGRDQRGDGMDLSQLSEVCLNLGADKAINLDGGGSSQLIWKNENDNSIKQTNPSHEFVYPVGNIISFVREA